MVAPRRRAAVSYRATAAAAVEWRAEQASTGRRVCLLAALSAVMALTMPGCGSTPARHSPDASRSQDLDDLDLTDGGYGSEVVMQALANVGKPYRWGGSDPGVGFDCSGLVAHVYDDAVAMKLPRTSREMSRRGTHIGRNRLAAGDLVFFNTSGRAYSHVGIYIGRGRFVHAPSTGSLVRVERIDNRYWSSRYVGARRLLPAI